jgi:hypothetical protein
MTVFAEFKSAAIASVDAPSPLKFIANAPIKMRLNTMLNCMNLRIFEE